MQDKILDCSHIPIDMWTIEIRIIVITILRSAPRALFAAAASLTTAYHTGPISRKKTAKRGKKKNALPGTQNHLRFPLPQTRFPLLGAILPRCLPTPLALHRHLLLVPHPLLKLIARY